MMDYRLRLQLSQSQHFHLGCRWRLPLTQVHNPSDVLLLYRDQLDAKTLDHVMVYVNVDGFIII